MTIISLEPPPRVVRARQGQEQGIAAYNTDLRALLNWMQELYNNLVQNLDSFDTRITALEQLEPILQLYGLRLDRIEDAMNKIYEIQRITTPASNPPTQAEVIELQDKVNEIMDAAFLPPLQT